MIKKRKIFSIYLTVVAILAGLLHGSFMVSAQVGTMGSGYGIEIDVISDGIYGDVAHTTERSGDNIATSNKTGNSLMPCCVEDFSDNKYQKFSENRKSGLLNISASNADSLGDVIAKKQADGTVFVSADSSPPEKIILESVIRLE